MKKFPTCSSTLNYVKHVSEKLVKISLDLKVIKILKIINFILNLMTEYKVIQKIGEGSFSEVLKCQDKVSGALYAAKRLKRTYLE